MEKIDPGIGSIGKNQEPEDVDFEETTSSNNNEIDLDDGLNEDEDSHDFMGDDFTKNIIDGDTKKSDSLKSNEINADDGSANADDIRRQLEEEENNQKSQYTKADFEQIAEIIIDIIDAIASASFKAWSGDSSDAAYSLNKEKKTKLIKTLTLILIKYQARFPIEFMFIIMLVMMYSGSYVKAKRFRRERKNPPLPKANEIVMNDISDNSSLTDEELERRHNEFQNKKSSSKSDVRTPAKRQRGRPRKT